MENEEIDLIEVMAKLWHRKKTIMYIALFFLVGGLVLAFFLPRKYTAQCTLGLEMEDRTTRISVEGMSPFQSMPMGDMRNTRIVSPAMYPDIFFSVPFQKELIYSPLYIDERGDTVTFYNYLVSGPERLALVADPSQVEQLTEEESKCLAYLKDAFSVKVNNKDGNLKITLDPARSETFGLSDESGTGYAADIHCAVSYRQSSGCSRFCRGTLYGGEKRTGEKATGFSTIPRKTSGPDIRAIRNGRENTDQRLRVVFRTLFRYCKATGEGKNPGERRYAGTDGNRTCRRTDRSF